MNWDQIESKWAAMTRRVQAEWKPCAEKAGTGLRSGRQVPGGAAGTEALIGQAQPLSGVSTAE